MFTYKKGLPSFFLESTGLEYVPLGHNVRREMVTKHLHFLAFSNFDFERKRGKEKGK